MDELRKTIQNETGFWSHPQGLLQIGANTAIFAIAATALLGLPSGVATLYRISKAPADWSQKFKALFLSELVGGLPLSLPLTGCCVYFEQVPIEERDAVRIAAAAAAGCGYVAVEDDDIARRALESVEPRAIFEELNAALKEANGEFHRQGRMACGLTNFVGAALMIGYLSASIHLGYCAPTGFRFRETIAYAAYAGLPFGLLLGGIGVVSGPEEVGKEPQVQAAAELLTARKLSEEQQRTEIATFSSKSQARLNAFLFSTKADQG